MVCRLQSHSRAQGSPPLPGDSGCRKSPRAENQGPRHCGADRGCRLLSSGGFRRATQGLSGERSLPSAARPAAGRQKFGRI